MNGWRKASKKALKNGHASHVHNNCDCTYAIRFDENTEVEGYDPDYYKSIYDNADGNNWKDKVNSMRKDYYAANRPRIRAQQNAASQARARRHLPENEGFFETEDLRTGDHNDVIKPHHLYKDLNKTQVGRDAIRIVEESGYRVVLKYGVCDLWADYGKKSFGVIHEKTKTIIIYVDETKTIKQTAMTFVHEANHINDFGDCKKSEFFCEIKATKHGLRKDHLTKKELKDIMKWVNENYNHLSWR